jgi:hypothetical protein
MGVNTLENIGQSTINPRVDKSNFKTAKCVFQNKNLKKIKVLNGIIEGILIKFIVNQTHCDHNKNGSVTH